MKFTKRAGEIKTTHIGFRFTGESKINLWGGGQGYIEMKATTIYNEDITDNRIDVNDFVNDGRFGCESIESAKVLCQEIWRVNRITNKQVRGQAIVHLAHSEFIVTSDEINNKAKRGV